MPSFQTEFNNEIISITIEEAFVLQDGAYVSVGHIGYWSMAQPGLASGTAVKDAEGRVVVFNSATDAQQAAEAAARASM
jgi:hypothetical protein